MLDFALNVENLRKLDFDLIYPKVFQSKVEWSNPGEMLNIRFKDFVNTSIGPDVSYHSLGVVYCCSVLASGIAEVFTYPFDLVKTHLHIQGEFNSKVGAAQSKPMRAGPIIREIINSQGFFAIYSGFLPMMIRYLTYSGVRLVTYDYWRSKFCTSAPDGKIRISFLGSICASALAGVCGAIPSNPSEIVKIRKQMEVRRKMLSLPPLFESVPKAYLELFQNGGYLNLFKGLTPSLQRACLISIGEITGYDISKNYLLNYANLNDSFGTHVIASFSSGFFATLMSTPSDVLKSRLMNQPVDKNGKGLLYKGTMDCLIKTVRNEGILALYKGFLPIALRMGPSALIFWITFEQLCKIVGGSYY